MWMELTFAEAAIGEGLFRGRQRSITLDITQLGGSYEITAQADDAWRNHYCDRTYRCSHAGHLSANFWRPERNGPRCTCRTAATEIRGDA